MTASAISSISTHHGTVLVGMSSILVPNLWAAYCVPFAYYNFCRIHKALRGTPALAAETLIMYGILPNCFVNMRLYQMIVPQRNL